MNSNSLTTQEALEVIGRGQFYFPAYKRYSSNPVNVSCSFCQKPKLICSIGYQSYNLCLECVQMLVNPGSPKQYKQNFLQQNPNPNQKPNLTQNSNQIIPSNDFGTNGNTWNDMFNSSLNPSGMSNYKIGQCGQNGQNSQKNQNSVISNNNNLSREHFGSATNNPSAFNNSSQTDYLETFYQPITPGGLPKRG
jgi:hypothetical protein